MSPWMSSLMELFCVRYVAMLLVTLVNISVFKVRAGSCLFIRNIGFHIGKQQICN